MGENDLLLGRIAVEMGLAKASQVEECIRLQQKTRRPLGLLLVEKGYIKPEHLDRILEEQSRRLSIVDPLTQRRKEAALFGKLAVREGYVTSEAMNECLALQAREGETRTLGEILVERGYLTGRQVQELLGKQSKRIMQCTPCRLRFTVVTLSEGKNARCPRCKNPLAEAKEGPVSTDAEFTTQVMKAVQLPPPPSARPTIRTTCVVCESGFEASPDATGRLRCPVCKSSFVPR